jgi:hypothetical protein
MVKLQLQSYSFLLTLVELICQTMHLLEQFFEAFFALSIVVDVD